MRSSCTRTRIAGAVLVAGAWMACLLPSGPAAAASATYRLFDHPDGNQNPPPYGLRLDGLEWYVTDGGTGGDSDAWTFSFTDMTGTLTLGASDAENIFRISGTAKGGKDTGSESLDGGADVSIEFTYLGFSLASPFDPLDPELMVTGSSGANGAHSGSITFHGGNGAIEAGTVVDLIAWGNSAGSIFDFKTDGHRLDCGGADASLCDFPVGRGWLGLAGARKGDIALRGSDEIYHTSFQDFLLTSRIPGPSTLALLLAGTFLALGARRRAERLQ